MELEFNYNDIHDILDIKFTKKKNELISKILQHFLLNDVLNEKNFNEIKKNHKSKWDGRTICALQYYKSLNIWLKPYQKKYGSIVIYDKNKNQCILSEEWKLILNSYKNKNKNKYKSSKKNEE